MACNYEKRGSFPNSQRREHQPHVPGLPQCYVIGADGNVNFLDFPKDSLAICIRMKTKKVY